MTTARRDLSSITRPSGAFAMLAIDQREALRAMFAEHQTTAVSDEQVTDFKLAATRALTPYASAVLLDKQFVLDRAIEEGAIDENCALVAAADEFIPSRDELVADTRIDPAVDPAEYARQGAKALKLLVIYRPDTDPVARASMVEEFVRRCRAHDLISIVEPVSRAPLGGDHWDWNAGVLAAAKELGALGADLYKAEVPHHGEGDADLIRADCAAITDAVDSPWVVLSSGVQADTFPEAVRIACSAGASGFLCGRAVWSGAVGRPDYPAALSTDAVARLQRLCAVVDETVAGR